MPLLTYLAQVRQLPFKSDKPLLHHVFIMLPFLHTKRFKNRGTLRKGIATIGIVPGVAWVVQNRSMVVLLKDAGRWLKTTRYISSRLLVGDGK